jgi:N-acetylneuraminate synthase
MKFLFRKIKHPYIIAEMSSNHNQSIDRALEIVDAAAYAGVDALKLQTYTPDTMTINSKHSSYLVSDKKSLWKGEYLYDLYKKAYLPWEWHKAIFHRCKARNIVGFSAPFDDTAVDFLETLDVPLYKISSFELVHLPLIKKVAQTKKPIIMSIGMANKREIREAVETAKENGCKELVLLKCTSSYPADPKEANLLTIPKIKKNLVVK